MRARQDRAISTRVAAASTLAVLLLAVVAGCGDGEGEGDSAERAGGGPTTVVDAQAWVQALEADCAELNEDYRQLATADPSNREEAVAHARSVEAFAAELDDVLDGAGVPDDRRAEAEQLSDRVDQLEDAAEALADAAEAGDATAAATAAQQLADAGAGINPIAVELGVPACGGF